MQISLDKIDVFAAKIPFPAADDGYGMGFCVGYSRIQGLINDVDFLLCAPKGSEEMIAFVFQTVGIAKHILK